MAKSVVVGLAVAFVAVALNPSMLGRPASAGLSYADAVERSAGAVVSLYSANAVGARSPVGTRQVASLGSGVIMTGDGYIVTNQHVVDGVGDLFVSLQSGEIVAAALIGIDIDTDLALLRLDTARYRPNLTPIVLGDSTDVRVGDVVLAIGNPFGIGQTVTQGIVSATGRSQLGMNSFEDFVQTDAAINPGNSGGALVNARGEMIGINAAVVTGSGSEGISFAIPVNLVRGVVSQLIENGRVIRGWLGVTAESLAPGQARMMGIDGGGIVLNRVYADSPAANAGLVEGDIITRINGEPVIQLKDALHSVARLAPGTRIALAGVRRGGQQAFNTSATVTERPPQIAARGD
ncbi:MAG: trypsin-like peptidase domain-containing protein [Pseudomonadota bacterium]